MFCGCDDVNMHTLALLFYPTGNTTKNYLSETLEKLAKVPPQPKPKQKCLTFGDAAGTATTHDTKDATDAEPDILDAIDTEDLERLFATDDGGDPENDTG